MPSTPSSTAGSSPPSAPRPARSPASTPRRATPAGTWRIGMVHGSLVDPRQDRPRRGRDHDRRDRRQPVSTTSRSVTGTRRSRAAAGTVTYAYSGAPEPVALDQDRAGKVLLVELDEAPGKRIVTVEERRRRTDPLRRSRARRRAPSRASRPSSRRSPRRADPDLVLDVRLVGVRRDDLDLDIDEVEARLAPSFLKVRVRDRSIPALTAGSCRRPTRSPAPSSATSRRASPTSRRPASADEAARAARRAPPRPAAARRVTRSRCEDPPAPASRTSAAIASSTSSSRPG